MKQAKKKNFNIKMIAAVALCGFSAVSLVSGAVAWFSASRVSKGSGDSMTAVEPSPIFKKMSFHNYVHIDYVNNTLKFNQNATGYIEFDENGTLQYYGDTSVSLGTYDQLNQTQPVLCLIELDTKHVVTAEEPIVVSAKTEETYIGASEDKIVAEGNPLSSVVRFYSNAYADGDALDAISGTYTSAEVTYDVYNVGMKTIANSDSFAKFTNEYTYTSFDPTPTLYEGAVNDEVTYIGIVFDYYTYALEYIYNTYLGLDILDDTITFACDWTMVI